MSDIVRIVCLVCMLSSLEAVSQYVLIGAVSDRYLQQPIAGVKVAHNAGNALAITDSDGLFQFETSRKSITLRFSHVAYKDTTVQIRFSDKSDTLLLHLTMVYETYNLPAAEIGESPAPETVFGSTVSHVADFCFLDDYLLLLGYSREDRWKSQNESKITRYHGCRLFLQDSLGVVVDSLTVSDEITGLETAFDGTPFLITEKDAYEVYHREGRLGTSIHELSFYADRIKPLIDSIQGYYLLSDYAPDYPAFSVYSFEPGDTAYIRLRTISDKLQMELMRSEYKYLPTRQKLDAYRLELKTGIDKEIIASWMSGFSQSLYAESLYAPVIVLNDTICIFDHYSDQLARYLPHSNRSLDSIRFGFHEKKSNLKYRRKLIPNDEKTEVYAVFERSGFLYLRQYHLDTGDLAEPRRLSFRYPARVKIRKGYAYYLYRPFESDQKYFLYREQL